MSLFEITDFIPRLTKLLHDAVQANARLSLEKRELEKERNGLADRVVDLQQDHRLLAAAGIGGEAFADDHKLATIVADAQSETAFLKAELLKAQEELHLKGVESERLVAEYNKCVEERMALSTEVASFRTQITSEQIDSIEESNSLRQTILQHEQTLLAKTQEVEVLQTEIKTLQTQNELVRIETQAKLDEAEGEKTALSSKLEELRNTAARGQNHIGAMLIEANLEIERLKKALAAAQEASNSVSILSKSVVPKSRCEKVDFAAHASPLPEARRKVLESLPKISVELPDDGPHAYFTRPSLCSIIGGSMQALIVPVVGSAKELAKKWDISGYLCPKMNHNPWSPVAPGEHGYMMVGLGREKETFMEPEIRHIFVGCESSHQYAGLYSCVRVEPLTKEEWFILPEHVKTTYVETTRDKEKRLNPGPTSKVRAEYDTGERRAPCVMLQCIEFNPEFYNELVAANDNFFAPCTTSPSKLKRARPAEDEAGEANSNTISPGSSTKRANTSMASSASPQRKSSRVSVRIIMPDYVEH